MSEIHPDVVAAAEAALAAGLAAVDVAAVADLPAPALDDWGARTSWYRLRWFPAGELSGPPDAHGRRGNRAGWHIQRWDDGDIEPEVRAAFQALVRAASGRLPGADPSAAAGDDTHQPTQSPAVSGGDMPVLVEAEAEDGDR